MNLLAEISQNPGKIKAYMAQLDRLEQATASLERAQSVLPGIYAEGTASAAYDRDEITALREQVTVLTKSLRAVVETQRVLLIDLQK